MAADLRRVGPTLALADHRTLIAQQATELEAEAQLLDAEADRAERGGVKGARLADRRRRGQDDFGRNRPRQPVGAIETSTFVSRPPCLRPLDAP
jgi:hypothetical protein